MVKLFYNLHPMNRIVIRHGLQMRGHPFENEGFGPPLTDQALADSRFLAAQLRYEWAEKNEEIDLGNIAVSSALRARQTAKALGATYTPEYEQLSEVELTEAQKHAMLQSNNIPYVALEMGAELAANPPGEHQVIITHGGRIAGLCAFMGIHIEQFLPAHLEYRVIDF